MDRYTIEINESQVGIRIDKLLSDYIDGKSRSFIQNLIDEKQVLVNEKEIKSNYKVRLKDLITVDIPQPKELEVEAENISLEIIYEDNDVALINKPQGMVVHPAVGNYTGTLVNALLHHCNDLSGINGVIRPGIVHRIDKDTSGILIVAKNDNAHNSLSEQFKEHSITRIYYALVEGRIKLESGSVDAPLARNPKDRLKIAIVKNGKRAVTNYEVLERFDNYTLVKCKLETGRTHQIRVHMAHIGHPLVGDPVYGYKKQKFKLEGQLLHAGVLGFVHPTTKEYMEFSVELPYYFEDILKKLRG